MAIWLYGYLSIHAWTLRFLYSILYTLWDIGSIFYTLYNTKYIIHCYGYWLWLWLGPYTILICPIIYSLYYIATWSYAYMAIRLFVSGTCLWPHVAMQIPTMVRETRRLSNSSSCSLTSNPSSRSEGRPKFNIEAIQMS